MLNLKKKKKKYTVFPELAPLQGVFKYLPSPGIVKQVTVVSGSRSGFKVKKQ